MARQLNIRSDRAVELARDLAQKHKKPVARVVEDALKACGGETSEERLERWREMLKRNREHVDTSDFELDDMYDEIGLPK